MLIGQDPDDPDSPDWIEAPMSKERFITLDVDAFHDWATKYNIDWNVRTVPTISNDLVPCFLFKRQEDIVVFRLKFGV